MAFFALLWKARTIEKYRLNYEKEKINSLLQGHKQMEQTLSQRWRHYRHDTKKRISRTLKKWYPDGSGVSNFFFYLGTDQTFPNFLLKSVMGFVGGIILTYLCFMFFVFQLSISLIHATIMSSIIGVLLTLGLAFSYRIRCLVFLLIPQFFSRVGRYTLTCYALVLILTGPATNTLKNSEVLSESMACSQEQIKTNVHQINDLMKKPINAMKDSLKLMVDRLKIITAKVKEAIIRLDRLVLSIVSVIQSSFSWLQSVADICNTKLGTPYERCSNVMQDGISDCEKTLGPDISAFCQAAHVAEAACHLVKPFKAFCYATDYMDEAILASVKKKLRNFTEHLRAMFHVEIHIHHSYSFSSNTSRSASQVAAGIVTEIRNRADPLLTWLSWSSCVTSLFLLLIIFRAKYYQHMYETRSRFDNRYVTKELQELDLKRQRQGRETVLPLNRRERAKYITTTSFRLVASEKVYLNRSAVFMAITTFKLLIHMVADYSLYWVLMTIRYHGKYQSDLMPGIPQSGVHVSGSGFVARLFRSIVGILDIPLSFPAPSPIPCLPDPYPPDLRRYTQIGVLIFLLWFFALFEPYGLRLRHLIMGHYRPERAKARATWLYNHILRTRASFMKFARRKLHREYKYSSEASLTFRQWITDHIPFQCLRSLLGFGPKEQHCLLCGTTSSPSDPDSRLTSCQTPGCPGIFCISCFTDIGELCTICLSPADYGDLSDISFEKGSSDDSDSDGGLGEDRSNENMVQLKNLPFQWREAPKYELCTCQDKNCSCQTRQADKYLKLFEALSKQKIFAKKALERFRNKVNTVDSPSSSLVQKMLNTINAAQNKTPVNHESSICISKRTSFYRTFSKELAQQSDVLGTDMLFKNEHFLDNLVQDPSELIAETSKFTMSSSLLGRELIVSRSSKKRSKPRVTRRCKCDVYEDLQRKWAHVKKSFSGKAYKHPISMMKNFCSSLFGPSCTIDTCPNKREKEKRAKEERLREEEKTKESRKTKSKKSKKSIKKTTTQTEEHSETKKDQVAIQTQEHKNTETQIPDESEKNKREAMKREKQEEESSRKERKRLEKERQRLEKERERMEKERERMQKAKEQIEHLPLKRSECQSERENLSDCVKKEKERIEQAMPKQTVTVNKGMLAGPQTSTGICQVNECPSNCNRSVQYDKTEESSDKQVGSIKCLCDQAVQYSTVQPVCTCATQHVAFDGKEMSMSFANTDSSNFLNQESSAVANIANKKIQHKQVAHKGTHYAARKEYTNKDASTLSKRHKKLSLESSICVFDRSTHATEAMHDVLTDTITDTSISSISVRSDDDDTRTDTTICSLATVDFEDTPRRRKFRVKVITKTNQSTLTEKTRLCDTGTITHDWWSPIVERKGNDEILLEKKKGYNAIEKQKKDLKELKEWKELKEVKKRRKNCGVTTDGRIVTFRSRTQIIPTGLFPGRNDVMSPSRYLLESQKYYNELFSYNFRPPSQVDYTCVTQMSKYHEKEKSRSPLGNRRNRHRKTKRLEECYSPRRQLSPRKRQTESTKTSDSPRRKPHTHRHSNNRHYSKYSTPRKLI